MIVVEGPDGAGKSTLVRWICKEFGLREGKRLTDDRDEIFKTTREDSFYALYMMMRAKEPPRVWDRIGFISDPIYAPFMNRRVAFTDREREVLLYILQRFRVPVIVCLPPPEVVEANVRGSHQIKAAKDHIHGIYTEYRAYPYGFTYDYTKDDLLGVADIIANYLYRRKGREALCS